MSLKPQTRDRAEIAAHYKWDLTPIFSNWDEWAVAYKDLEQRIEAYTAFKGTLASGPDRLLAAFQSSDQMGQLVYKVWYYPALTHDQDQRDNTITAKRQQVQILMARWSQATSWFKPELLKIPLDVVQKWMEQNPQLAVYRFAIEDLYRLQEHVLDEAGERLLSFASRVDGTASESYSALSTADVIFPEVTLSTGEKVTVTYGEYRSILAINRNQADRAVAFRAFHEVFNKTRNTYAALYDGVCQDEWFHARARSYGSTLEAALNGNNIPTSVVENLIETTRRGTEPLRRYHRLRKRVLGLDRYYGFDGFIPLIDHDARYPYDEVLEWIVESVAPIGAEYQARVRTAFRGGWIDVYENEGKRSGAYSAPVYGIHPYMLMNYNDTLDAVFTLAHEMGHTMHTILSHENQPFVYSDYTIFVAEVPSTLNEELLLERMLAHSTDPRERVVLLQHAIDSITGTFYNQVLFADYELQAHRLVERDKPVTADVLSEIYGGILTQYYGDVLSPEPLARLTWSRVPHFYGSPYYVYQYATCFASAAALARQIKSGSPESRRDAVDRYLNLLKAGGSDHPMALLREAGVDLSEPDTVQAVIDQFDGLVTRLERELEALGATATTATQSVGSR